MKVGKVLSGVAGEKKVEGIAPTAATAMATAMVTAIRDAVTITPAIPTRFLEAS